MLTDNAIKKEHRYLKCDTSDAKRKKKPNHHHIVFEAEKTTVNRTHLGTNPETCHLGYCSIIYITINAKRTGPFKITWLTINPFSHENVQMVTVHINFTFYLFETYFWVEMSQSNKEYLVLSARRRNKSD